MPPSPRSSVPGAASSSMPGAPRHSVLRCQVPLAAASSTPQFRAITMPGAPRRRVLRCQSSREGQSISLPAKPAIDCSTRKRIVLGAARGLLYLHEQCDPKIIHRDVKASNVLLDDFCEAIVRDFSLAKLLYHRDSHVTTAVRGTIGHIAPEYLSTGQSSEKN